MDFEGELSYWRGRVGTRIGRTEWTTSLFPKEGRHLLPIEAPVRRVESGLNDEGLVGTHLKVETRW